MINMRQERILINSSSDKEGILSVDDTDILYNVNIFLYTKWVLKKKVRSYNKRFL